MGVLNEFVEENGLNFLSGLRRKGFRDLQDRFCGCVGFRLQTCTVGDGGNDAGRRRRLASFQCGCCLSVCRRTRQDAAAAAASLKEVFWGLFLWNWGPEIMKAQGRRSEH